MVKKKSVRGRKTAARGRWRVGRLWSSIRMPLFLVAIALVPRLAALAELTGSPLFYYPAIDSKVYHELAIEIASGDLIGNSTFWQAPLYPYFLGAIYRLFGTHILAAKLIQMVLSAVNCYLVFLLAIRLFGSRVAWPAYAATVLCGPLIFFASELLAPVLLNFLILPALLTMISYSESPRRFKLVFAGALLGLLQIGHGLIAAFLPLLAVWLILLHRRRAEGTRRGIRASAYLLIGFVPLILATAVRNYALDGEFVMVSSNVGANLYLGNHPNYDSTTAIRPGLEWDEFIQQAAAKGHATPAQSSAYFSEKALGWMIDDPIGFAALLAKKLYLLAAGEEIKRNLDIYHFRGYSLLLKILIWRLLIAFPSGLILPLAIGWMVMFSLGKIRYERSHDMRLLLLFVLSQAAAILMFFVSTRYRLVMLPVCIVFASAMLLHLYDMFRTGRIRAAVPASLLLAVLIAGSNMPRVETKPKDSAENLFYEGLAYSETGNCADAMEKYRQALAIHPDYAMVEYNLALCYQRTGNEAASAMTLDGIVRKNPGSFIAPLAVGKIHLDRGNLPEAERLFRTVLERNPNSVEAMLNLGDLYRVNRDSTRALAHFRAAVRINPRSYKAYNLIGAVYMERGLIAQAEANFRRAWELNRSYPSALNNLATVLGQTNRIDEAERLLKRAFRLAPNDVTTLLNLGATMLRRNKPGEALKLFDRAVSSAPMMPQAHHSRGIALESLGRHPEAAAAFRRALSLNPGFSPARQELHRMGLEP